MCHTHPPTGIPVGQPGPGPGKVEPVQRDDPETDQAPSTAPAPQTRQAPVPTQPPRRTLWRHRDFLLLWSGQTVSEMGSAVTVLALPLTAVVVLHASTFQVGLLSSAATVAFALIALPAGALVDRRAKRRVMIWCDLARMPWSTTSPRSATGRRSARRGCSAG